METPEGSVRPQKARLSASHIRGESFTGTPSGAGDCLADRSLNSNAASNATTVDQARESLETLMMFVSASDQQTRENAELKEKNGILEDENAELQERIARLEETVESLQGVRSNDELRLENRNLRDEIAVLNQLIVLKTREIDALRGHVVRLENGPA